MNGVGYQEMKEIEHRHEVKAVEIVRQATPYAFSAMGLSSTSDAANAKKWSLLSRLGPQRPLRKLSEVAEGEQGSAAITGLGNGKTPKPSRQ